MELDRTIDNIDDMRRLHTHTHTHIYIYLKAILKPFYATCRRSSVSQTDDPAAIANTDSTLTCRCLDSSPTCNSISIKQFTCTNDIN